VPRAVTIADLEEYAARHRRGTCDHPTLTPQAAPERDERDALENVLAEALKTSVAHRIRAYEDVEYMAVDDVFPIVFGALRSWSPPTPQADVHATHLFEECSCTEDGCARKICVICEDIVDLHEPQADVLAEVRACGAVWVCPEAEWSNNAYAGTWTCALPARHGGPHVELTQGIRWHEKGRRSDAIGEFYPPNTILDEYEAES